MDHDSAIFLAGEIIGMTRRLTDTEWSAVAAEAEWSAVAAEADLSPEYRRAIWLLAGFRRALSQLSEQEHVGAKPASD